MQDVASTLHSSTNPVLGAVCSVHCLLCSIQCIFFKCAVCCAALNLQGIACSFQLAAQFFFCTVCSVMCTVFSVQCAVQCVLYIRQCEVCRVQPLFYTTGYYIH